MFNNAGVSLPMLLTIKPIHLDLDFKIFLMHAIVVGKKCCPLKLFQMNPGVYWVQVNLQKSLGFSTIHVIMLSITKPHRHSSSKEKVITLMEDN